MHVSVYGMCPCVELKLTFLSLFLSHNSWYFVCVFFFWQIEFSYFFVTLKLKIVHFSVSIVVELAVCVCEYVCVDD